MPLCSGLHQSVLNQWYVLLPMRSGNEAVKAAGWLSIYTAATTGDYVTREPFDALVVVKPVAEVSAGEESYFGLGTAHRERWERTVSMMAPIVCMRRISMILNFMPKVFSISVRN